MDEQPEPTTDEAAVEQPEALIAALVEIENHVGLSGWDQPARLFALVPTAQLLQAEPQLAGSLTVTSPDALSSIEQEDFRDGDDLMTTLSRITWGDKVAGCALSVERTFLPAGFEGDIPDDPGQAATFVAGHPQRQDIRVVVGALRDGSTHGVARLVKQPEDLLGGADLVPALSRALAETLR